MQAPDFRAMESPDALLPLGRAAERAIHLSQLH